MSGENRGSEALTKLQWTTIFNVGLCVGKKEREGSFNEATLDHNLSRRSVCRGKERKCNLNEATVDHNL